MIQFSILTLQGSLYEGKADYISVPAIDGWLGILPNHIPLITSLKSGKITIRSKGGEQGIDIERGFIEVRPRSEVVVLATTHKQ